MNLVTEPASEIVEWFSGSTVVEISHGLSGLRIVIAAPIDDDRFCEIHFPYPRAFQAIPESDMLSYWDQPLGSGRFLYRVSRGGWIERTSDHYFQVISSDINVSEWLVVTDTGLCVTILSSHAPHVREYGHAV